MKIEATPLPSGTAATLGDESAGDVFEGMPPLPTEKRSVQQEDIFRSETPFTKGRGNRKQSFSWTVLRTHTDEATATSFLWGHAADVPIDCSLVITDGGSTLASFSAAVIEEVAIVEQIGKSTRVRYSVMGAVPE